MPLMTSDQRTLLVTLLARAMSSVGFGISILAIWLEWLVPSLKPDVPDLPRIKPATRPRRYSAPHGPRHTPRLPSLRRVSAPAVPHPITPPLPASSSPVRHVYFLDSQTTPSRIPNPRSYPIPSEQMYDEPEDLYHQPEPEPEPEPDVSSQSSVSSSLTLVSTPPAQTHHVSLHCLDTCDESIAESDSSRRSSIPSLLLSNHIPRMKNAFLNKGRGCSPACEAEASCSVSSTPPLPDEPVKPVRRSSIGFAPWSISRCRTTPETTSELTSAKSSRISFGRRSSARSTSKPTTPSSMTSPSRSNTVPSSSYFSRKTDRRRSTPAPVARTQPYAHPYYAAPPTLAPVDPSYSSYLRGLPQFGDEISSFPERMSESDEQKNGSDETRGRDRRQSNSQAQTGLGHGRRPVPKRRSASESWAQRSGLQL